MSTTTLRYMVILAVLLTGCASSNSGAVYTRDQTRQPMTVKTGVVEAVRLIKIEGTDSGIGAATGAVVGGVAGSSTGGGKGKVIATTLGALAGGLIGAAAEGKLTGKDGLELTVKLDNGTTIAVVQEADEPFNSGDRVRILEDGGVTRVSH